MTLNLDINTNDMVSVSEASSLGVSKLVADAAAGRELVIFKLNKPTAAVISVGRLARLRQLEERESGVGQVVTALARMLVESQDARDLDALQADLGIEDAQLVRPV